jgi:F0F1-type ATP synthase assembly protein I
MSPTRDQPDKNRSQYAFNLTLAAVAGQVGCLTLVIVLAALIGGLWLDAQFDTRPLITIILMVASVPITLVLMFWVVRKATSHIRTTDIPKSAEIQEEAESGRKK